LLGSANQSNGTIQLRQLRYFVSVAEELSFRAAAERLHIDPTPLARAIRDLEERLGVDLLRRTTRTVGLTPAGQRLLDEARDVLVRIEHLARVVRETDARFRTPLRIGIADELTQTRLAKCLGGWSAVMPEVPLEIVDMRTPEVVRALRLGELDVGFSFGFPVCTSITQEVAWDDAAVALLPAGHELACHSALSLRDVLAFPLISQSADGQSGLAPQVLTLAELHASTPAVLKEACTLAGCVTHVAAGFGVGIIDADHAAGLRREDVVIRSIRESSRISTFVAHKQAICGAPDALLRFIAHARGDPRKL
jgi:DNA-binding transcriptional LysR family regulator